MTREPPALRFLRAAQARRIHDLEQLSVLGELVRALSALIHALQKERGTSSIFLGSSGARFAAELEARAAESARLEQAVRCRLEKLGPSHDRAGCGARFYTCIALCFDALDSLAATRASIAALESAPHQAVKSLTEIIAALLAVGFEAADMAADPQTSRALVALVNFAQGKEYAGQERAVAGGAFSRGSFDDAERLRLRQLEGAQRRAFEIFGEFAAAERLAAFQRSCEHGDWGELRRLRDRAQEQSLIVLSDEAALWYEVTTLRIDAMRAIEDALASDLAMLCAAKLEEARAGCPIPGRRAGLPVAMLLADVEPGSSGQSAGIHLYGLGGEAPQAMRSILDVLGEQARRLEDLSSELESARSALAERKVIEQAKGLLMKSRKLSEKDAYALLRQTAMNRNKRIFEVAAALVSMAELLPP